jgi:F-type H+-transporting ATPase subunit alpha
VSAPHDTFSKDRVRGALRLALDETPDLVRRREEGRVIAARDGVLDVSGLPGAAADGLIEVAGEVPALVLGLDKDRVRAVALDDTREVTVGARARLLSGQVSVPVSESLFRRVIDPLGRPLDGLPLEGRQTLMPLDSPAPGIAERASVHRPLYTGVLAIDAMFPIGRGQRELIIGNEGTGKTSLVLDVILRQANTDVVCVYVAVGRRRTETWRIAEELSDAGRWIIVAAPEDNSPALRHLAPYAGCAVAEYFVERGEHALVVYDDLTAHAVAWRELSLLLGRPPGREAFPGDIFYQHSRLLERATQLSAERGGGSLTALPLARLESGRLDAYIPTNLISITDGQVVLSEPLFAAGQKPPVDAGLSVSRVGGRAQPQAFRELAGRLRLEYAGFLELETFARLSSRLEAGVQKRLAWGRRVRRLLRARRLEPLGVFDEVVRLALATDRDLLLQLREEDVRRAASDVTATLRREQPEVAASLEPHGRARNALA